MIWIFYLVNFTGFSMMAESSKQIFAEEVIKDVQSTWQTINSDLQALGIEIFDKLFERFPDYQSLFRPFKNIPKSELKDNEKYRHHALSVATALNTTIENLDNPEKLVSVLNSIGVGHAERGITPEHFSNTEDVIADVIIGALSEKATDQIISSWNEVLTVAASAIMKGAEDEENRYAVFS